jgi:serine/threonine protein kinase
VADALAVVHKAGICHRDVSTNNIMLTYEGSKITGVKLIDFGIAKWRSGSEHTLRAMMKEHYASPEQIAFEHLDGRSDIYSLGIVYYELITGRKPFKDFNRKELPPSPARLGLNLPENIDRLIMQMMAPEKIKRVQNAGDIPKLNGTAPLGGKLYIAAPKRTSAVRTAPQHTKPWRFPGVLADYGKLIFMAGICLLGVVFTAFIFANTSTGNKQKTPSLAVQDRNPGYNFGTAEIGRVYLKEPTNICPKCGTIYKEKDLKYCTKDGAPLEESLIKAEQVAKKTPTVAVVTDKECPKCGAVYHDKNIKFCTVDATPLVVAKSSQ